MIQKERLDEDLSPARRVAKHYQAPIANLGPPLLREPDTEALRIPMLHPGAGVRLHAVSPAAGFDEQHRDADKAQP